MFRMRLDQACEVVVGERVGGTTTHRHSDIQTEAAPCVLRPTLDEGIG
jgi:hypothetical protein